MDMFRHPDRWQSFPSVLDQSVTNLTVVRTYGDKAEINWLYDVSCYVTKGVKITYTTASNVQKEVTLPAAQSSYVLDDLYPNNDYSVAVVTVYEGSETSEVEPLQFNSGDLVDECGWLCQICNTTSNICLVYRHETSNRLLSCMYLYTLFHWFNFS